MQIDGIKVKFCDWHRWDDRVCIPFKNEPGVSILALGVSAGEECKLTDKRIIYIGETCARLLQRWRQFDRAAFKNGQKHSGGRKYRESIAKTSSELFVAACALIIKDELERSAFIRFLERKLILDFTQANGKLPECNSE
jgi:hypothetical protein